MASQTRKCPRCGHDNVSRALFCFQCGRDLSDGSIVDGAVGTGKMVSDALRFVQEHNPNIDPATLENLQESRAKEIPVDVIGTPLTCLNCGKLNRTDASECIHCQASLVVADEDFELVPHVSARTSMGAVRKNNEDSLNLWSVDGVLMALIADGMGGAAAGEEASRLAVEAVQADFLGDSRGSDQLHTLSEMELGKRLISAIHDANRAVIDKALKEPQLKGMGTTSTLLMTRANRAIVAHVGDSRAYHIDATTGQISQVTSDHSFVQALVASGHITPEQALTHPMGSVLYRALGQSTDLEVDIYTRFLRAGDSLVICSDGLTRHVLPEDILRVVSAESDPHVATQRLIALANERGGEDNISVIVFRIESAATE